jgi:hypothetical protein
MATALQRGFEVEWCTKLPRHPMGGGDFDRADYSSQDATSMEEAQRVAAAKASHSKTGVAQIRQFMVDRYGQRDYVGEMIEVEGAA